MPWNFQTEPGTPADEEYLGLIRERSAGRHLLAAAFAIALSAGLHVALVRWLPSLPVGRPPAHKALQRIPAVRLQDVQHNVTARPERPPQFEPRNPEAFVDLAVDSATFEAALADVLVQEPPDVSEPPLAGSDAALLEPEPLQDRTPWEPRQEIMVIENAVHADDISVLPRAFTPAVPRIPAAPDITLPMDVGALDSIDRLATAMLPGMGASDDRLAALLNTGPLMSEEAGDGAGVPSPLPEPSRLLDEAIEEVTRIEPVEDLLQLEVSTYRPVDEPAWAYFKINVRRKGEEALPVLPKDVLLIQDTSESMTPRKLDECKKGLQEWIRALGPEDRFDLLAFRQDAFRCFGEWRHPDPVALARANWFIESLEARGRTDVYASLQAVLSADRVRERPLIAVLITDGRPTAGVVDSSEIIERFSQVNEGRLSMFAFGGGRRVNRFLLDLLSFKNRGDALVVADRRQIAEGIADWSRQLSRPVLADLDYRFAGIEESEVYPRTLTNLYLDRPLEICGRVPATWPKVVFQVVGDSGSRRHDMVFELDWASAAPGEEDLRTQWAWQKVYHLIGEHIQSGNEQALEGIRTLASRYRLAVPYGGRYSWR